jgi:hypothetical protein
MYRAPEKQCRLLRYYTQLAVFGVSYGRFLRYYTQLTIFSASHTIRYTAVHVLCMGKEIVFAENLHAKQRCSFLASQHKHNNVSFRRRNRNLHPALGGGSIKNLWTPHTL